MTWLLTVSVSCESCTPSTWLPDITLRSFGPVPPTTLNAAWPLMSTPCFQFGRVALPSGASPIRLFWMTLKSVSSWLNVTPCTELPEITLRSARAGLPIWLWAAPLFRLMPPPAWLVSSAGAPRLPLASTPMKLPTTWLLTAPRPNNDTPMV